MSSRSPLHDLDLESGPEWKITPEDKDRNDRQDRANAILAATGATRVEVRDTGVVMIEHIHSGSSRGRSLLDEY